METELEQSRLVAWRTFLTAHAALINQIERELLAAGVVPLSWYDVLFALYDAPGQRLRMNELASAIVLSRSGLTRLVDRLEAEGLLVRERLASDRRGAYAVLTGKGIEAMREAWPVYAKGIDEHFARYLNNEEARIMAGVFQSILSRAKRQPQLP
ncbi:MAG TPA: MarR family transcriptional regulator [Ktedonobacteraceae bacterium]|nr:MarR family transcriptional regulator [Ktedonobacteraceae bacterium]